MSKEDRIWREGDPRWEWMQGEPVPRYMWSQVPRSFVVGRLNAASELQQQVEALSKKLYAYELFTSRDIRYQVDAYLEEKATARQEGE